MNARKFLGQYLESPHVDVSYGETDEDDDGEAILRPIEQVAEPERPRHLLEPTQFRPLPRPVEPLHQPDGANSDVPKDTDRTGEAATTALPTKAITNEIPATEKYSEMSLADQDRRSTSSDAGDASPIEESIDNRMDNIALTEYENIEQIIEENFSTAIDRMVQSALHNIVIRRTKFELTSMTKLNSP